MRTSESNFRKNKVAYAVTAAVILMLQSSAMTVQAQESLIGEQRQELNPQYSDYELVWLLEGSSLTAQNNSLTHQNATLGTNAQRSVFFYIGLDSASEAQAIGNSMTLSESNFNFEPTAQTRSELNLINLSFYDSENITAHDNSLVIDDLEATNGNVYAYGVETYGADTIDAEGNTLEISDVRMTYDTSSMEQVIFDVTGVQASKALESSERAVYTIDDTNLTLNNIQVVGAQDSGAAGEDVLAVAARVYEADEVSSRGNTVTANQVVTGSAMFAGVRVLGEETQSVTLTENKVDVSQSVFAGQLSAYGARAAISGSAEISNNTVEVSDVYAGSLRLYGGRYYQTAIPTTETSVGLNGNELFVSGVLVSGDVDLYGARASASSSTDTEGIVVADSVQMNNNRLTLKDSVIRDASADIYAAYAKVAGDVEMNDNVLTVSGIGFGESSGAEITLGAARALGENVSLSGNQLFVNNSYGFNLGADLVTVAAIGTESAFVNNSLLEVENVLIERGEENQTTSLSASHLLGENARVTNSRVSVTDAEFHVTGIIQGAYIIGETLNAQNTALYADTIRVSDEALPMGLYGTDVRLTSGGVFRSSNTSVVLNNSNLADGYVLGAYVEGLGDNDVHLNHQRIEVSDSTVNVVSGLYLDLQEADGNVSAEVNDLTVGLTNASVSDGVYAGFTSAETGSEAGVQSVARAALGAIEVNNARLELTGVNSVGGVRDFDTFEMNVGDVNKNQALLTITGASPDGQKQFDGLTIELTSNEFLGDADTYRLIEVTGDEQYVFSDLKVKADETFVQTIYTATDDVVLTSQTAGLTSKNELFKNKTVSATQSSKTLSGTLLGSVAFINQGAEFIADEGLEAMTSAATDGSIAAFGAVHGGSSNYKADPRVDIDGYTLAAGAATKVTPDWVLGGFIEAGWAESDNHVQGSKAESDHDYYGVGVATRYMLNDAWYVDGSLRFGQASTEFSGSYAKDSAKYDSDTFYASAHAATGYVFDLTDSVKLDLYGRYTVTYLDGDEVSLHNRYEQKLDMDSTVTHAVRLGTRMTGSFCPYADWKVGVAYEHVFDGDAESAVNHINLEVPSLEGDTGVMEVGVTMKPNINSPWSLNLGAKGYVGDREGVTGQAVIRYSF